MSEDLKLQQRVVDELEVDPSVDAAHIGVTARDGVITLSGHVAHYAQKVAAEEAASRVHGVKAIAQQIEVEFAFDKKHADDEIAARAVKIMDWSVYPANERIQVSVTNGVVTLSGKVEWDIQRREAERQVRRLGGVRDVVNNISIDTRVDAVDVKVKLKNALERSADIEADMVDVEIVEPGRVVLSGSVYTLSDKAVVESAVWQIQGVSHVDNRLRITG